MKLRKVLAIFWMILLMLTATSYAENTENPIIADTQNGYLRMDVPYVKEVKFYGRSYIRCAFSTHEEEYLPYGIPVVNEIGKDYVLFDPIDDTVTYFRNPIHIENVTMCKYRFVKISGNTLMVYDAVKNMFPNLCNEVIAANRSFDAAHGDDFNQAERAVYEKDWEKAYKFLKKLYDDGCHDQAIIRDLDKACWELGNYDEALEWDTKRIEVTPNAGSYNSRAWHNYLLGNYEQALDDAQWAVMKDKEDANSYDTRGSIYYALGQYDKAMADFNKSLELDDTSAHTYYYRSLCNQALGRMSEADSDYGKAEKYDPNIIDDIGKFQHERLKHANAKQQRHQTKLNKYKDDLKKLNDAIYVTNNSSQFPARTVWENDGVIISVVGNIKQNENDDFYKEVVPQEVRTKYEGGVYQQQYEQLGPEVNAAVSMPGTGNGPQLASDGAIAAAPSTLPTNSSEEIYDLNSTVLKYYSEGQRYILSYEDPMKTYNYLKANYGPTTVDFVDRPHG
ncbi:MAG: tetratricopeptide repeat protein, partial [Anaerovibrio sp.]|nr:tetratricopeptide repeat protein [Anaerovibrio sp.]